MWRFFGYRYVGWAGVRAGQLTCALKSHSSVSASCTSAARLAHLSSGARCLSSNVISSVRIPRFANLLPQPEHADLLELIVQAVAGAERKHAQRDQLEKAAKTLPSPTSERRKLEALFGPAETEELIELCTNVWDSWSDLHVMADLLSEEECFRQRTPRDGRQQSVLENPPPRSGSKELHEFTERAEEREASLIAFLAWLEDTRVSRSGNRSPREALTSCVLELRPALGLFDAEWLAEDLVSVYRAFCSAQDWSFTPLGVEEAPSGTIEAMAFEVSGKNAYTTLQSESGVHRFIHHSLRPSNAVKQQKIFTSTVLVTLLPAADPVSDKIPEDDVEVTYIKHGGPGGTQGTKSTSGVALLHRPTGIRATCRETRGPLANYALAFQLLQAKVLRHRQSEREKEHESEINAMLGLRDTAERIRTYDYLTGKITDHRCKITLPNLNDVITTGVGFDVFTTHYRLLRQGHLAVNTAQRIRRGFRQL